MFKNVVFKSASQLKSFIESLECDDIGYVSQYKEVMVCFNYKEEIVVNAFFRKENEKSDYITIDVWNKENGDHCSAHFENEDGLINYQLVERALKKSVMYLKVFKTPIKSL